MRFSDNKFEEKDKKITFLQKHVIVGALQFSLHRETKRVAFLKLFRIPKEKQVD